MLGADGISMEAKAHIQSVLSRVSLLRDRIVEALRQ